ncbi:PilW family protein [Luteimonas sp. e5]
MNRARQQGLSLVELMVALAIGLVLLLGVMQIFMATRSSYALAEGVGRVQENGRFAMDYLQRDLRMAGHYGCTNDQARLQGATPNQLRSDFPTGGAFDFTRAVQGYDALGSGPGNTITLASPGTGWSPALPAWISSLAPAPMGGSDVVVLRFFSPEGVPINVIEGARAQFTPADWSSLTQDGIATPTVFAISDCINADVFAGSANAAAGTVQAGNTALDLDVRYSAGAEAATHLYRGEVVVYYVALGAGGGPSLWRARFASGSAVSEELVEGIENLQLIYGLDSAADPADRSGQITDLATAASLGGSATDWSRVGQVRVGVLARSVEPARTPQATTAPRLLGVTLTPPSDQRTRSIYESTVALRNRMFRYE